MRSIRPIFWNFIVIKPLYNRNQWHANFMHHLSIFVVCVTYTLHNVNFPYLIRQLNLRHFEKILLHYIDFQVQNINFLFFIGVLGDLGFTLNTVCFYINNINFYYDTKCRYSLKGVI